MVRALVGVPKLTHIIWQRADYIWIHHNNRLAILHSVGDSNII